MILRILLGIYLAAMNYAIESAIYWYYFQTALGSNPTWGKRVTVLQIVQMVLGMVVSIFNVRYLQSVAYCGGSSDVALYGFVLYLIYFMLLTNYFMHRYIFKKPLHGKRFKED